MPFHFGAFLSDFASGDSPAKAGDVQITGGGGERNQAHEDRCAVDKVAVCDQKEKECTLFNIFLNVLS